MAVGDDNAAVLTLAQEPDLEIRYLAQIRLDNIVGTFNGDGKGKGLAPVDFLLVDPG